MKTASERAQAALRREAALLPCLREGKEKRQEDSILHAGWKYFLNNQAMKRTSQRLGLSHLQNFTTAKHH